eukprot:6785286-Alexandrium_andersonii.AAC.1
MAGWRQREGNEWQWGSKEGSLADARKLSWAIAGGWQWEGNELSSRSLRRTRRSAELADSAASRGSGALT